MPISLKNWVGWGRSYEKKVNDVLEAKLQKLQKNCWDNNDFVTIKISFDDYDSLDYEFIANYIRGMNM